MFSQYISYSSKTLSWLKALSNTFVNHVQFSFLLIKSTFLKPQKKPKNKTPKPENLDNDINLVRFQLTMKTKYSADFKRFLNSEIYELVINRLERMINAEH